MFKKVVSPETTDLFKFRLNSGFFKGSKIRGGIIGEIFTLNIKNKNSEILFFQFNNSL